MSNFSLFDNPSHLMHNGENGALFKRMRTTIDISDSTWQVINEMCLQQHTTQEQCINKLLAESVTPRPDLRKKPRNSSVRKAKMSFIELMNSCPVKIDLDIGERTFSPHRDVDFS